MQAIWTSWIWAISGGGPFSYTLSFSGLGGQDVTAEASLSKIDQAWGDPRHVKSAVWAATRVGLPGTGLSNNWGIDGAPVRYLPGCNYLTLMLEVQRSYAAMVGKVYIH